MTRVYRRILAVATLLAMLAAASVGGMYLRYPGFTRAVLNQLRYADLVQNRNLAACLVYWLQFMQKLTINPSTHVWGFEGIAGTSDFEGGQLAYHRGDFSGAIDRFSRALQRDGESKDRVFWLAISYLRAADVDNCLAHLLRPHDEGDAPGGPGQYCALPITRFHERRASAEHAAGLFEHLLDQYGPDRLHQWLLNVSWMVLGGFPDRVPPRYRITGSFVDAFYGGGVPEMSARYSDLKFVERAAEFHLDRYSTGRGIAVEDFDHDGYLDIVTGGNFDSVVFYHNDGGRDFSDRTAEVGLEHITQPFSIVAADYDNDGWVDLFISRPFGRYSLYRNDHGVFHDVTSETGLLDGLAADEVTATWVPAFADVDNDGRLDLFLSQWGMKVPFTRGLMARPRSDSRLFMNEGGRFVDRTREFGLAPLVRDQFFLGTAFGDYDGDGFDDLFLSSPLLNTSVLLHNVGGRRFERVPYDDRHEGGFAAAFLDLNQDGRLDIFQAGFGDARTSTAQAVFGEGTWTHAAGHTTVHMQRDAGRFEDRSRMFSMPMGTMGSTFGDVNNDGCYDFYLGTGGPEGWFVLPNLMYMGRPEGSGCSEALDNVSMLFGLGTLQKGHAAVFFDFDNDGDEDLYSSLGGMWPGDAWPNQLFVNESTSRNTWVGVRLRGRQTNRMGVGAQLAVHTRTKDGQPAVRYAVMNNKTGFGSAPYLLHVGLRDADRIERIDVRWPVSRCAHSYAATINTINLLDEAACDKTQTEAAGSGRP
jgi:hypothetical protein